MHFKIFQRNQVKVTAAPADPAIADPAELATSASVDGFLTYALQLDAQRHIKGYKFEWRGVSETASASDNFRALVSTIAANLKGGKAGWRLGKLMVYLDVTAEGLALEELQALPPENVVLCVRLAELASEKLRPTLEALRDRKSVV